MKLNFKFEKLIYMRKYLLIILVLFSTIQVAQSQVLITLLLGDKLNSPNLEFGLEGGINWTQVTQWKQLITHTNGIWAFILISDLKINGGSTPVF